MRTGTINIQQLVIYIVIASKMRNIEELVEKHENNKIKWLRLTIDDLFNWNALFEEMLDLRTTLSSQYIENKNSVWNKKSIRWAILRSEINDAGKKKHTESSIEDIIKVEFEEDDRELNVLKTTIEMLTNKITTIPEYINLCKKALPIN